MRKAHKQIRNRRKGAVLAESAASLVLILPILLVAVFVAVEASIAFTISGAMNQSAYWAARRVATNYAIVQTHALTDASYIPPGQTADYGYNAAFMNHHIMVNSPSQFSMTYNIPPAGSTTPPTVTVTCQYLGKKVGLPPFPNPDYLNLSEKWGTALVISGTSTVRLQ